MKPRGFSVLEVLLTMTVAVFLVVGTVWAYRQNEIQQDVRMAHALLMAIEASAALQVANGAVDYATAGTAGFIASLPASFRDGATILSPFPAGVVTMAPAVGPSGEPAGRFATTLTQVSRDGCTALVVLLIGRREVRVNGTLVSSPASPGTVETIATVCSASATSSVAVLAPV